MLVLLGQNNSHTKLRLRARIHHLSDSWHVMHLSFPSFSISFLFLTFVSIWPLERGERSQISCPLLASLHGKSMAISGNWFSCLFRFNTRYFRQDGGRSKLHFAASNASFKSFSCCIKPRSQLITFVKDSRKTLVFPFLPFF